MITTKRLRAPLVVLSGVIMSVVALAGPASAANYGPAAGTTVLGTTATATVLGTTATTTTQAAGVSASAGTSGLAFTGTNAVGIGALGGLLLVGGGAMVLVGRRRKVNG